MCVKKELEKKEIERNIACVLKGERKRVRKEINI
jgi:hypothetical protein